MGGGGGCSGLDTKENNNLEKLFDGVPTSDEVRKKLAKETEQSTVSFVKKVEEALLEANELSVKVNVDSLEEDLLTGAYGQEIETILAQKGWDAELHLHTKKGKGYVELTPKNNEKA